MTSTIGVQMVRVDQIEVQEEAWSTHGKSGSIPELAESIRAQGIIQPLTVSPKRPKGFLLVCGRRRLEAAEVLGKREVPCIVRAMKDVEILEVRLVENLQREDVNRIEVALACQQYMKIAKSSQLELAKRIGMGQPLMSRTLGLLQLEPRTKDLMAHGSLPWTHGEQLRRINGELQVELAEKDVREQWSIRFLESKIEQVLGESNDGDKSRKKSSNPGATTRPVIFRVRWNYYVDALDPAEALKKIEDLQATLVDESEIWSSKPIGQPVFDARETRKYRESQKG